MQGGVEKGTRRADSMPQRPRAGWGLIAAWCLNAALVCAENKAPRALALRLCGGSQQPLGSSIADPSTSGHQGSDPNAKDPSGQWSSFQKIGGEQGGAVGKGLRTVCAVYGEASCRRRSQPNVTLRISKPKADIDTSDLDTLSPESFRFLMLENAKDICAVCTGVSFCGIPNHHIMCRCTPGSEITPTQVLMSRGDESSSILTGTVTLTPGQYQVKFQSNGEEEVLQGMWGVEEYRPLTVLPPPAEHALLLMSDIDGTLIGGEGDATDKFFWIWNEQYRPRGAHLVYNTGRPFSSAHKLIKENRLHPPTVLVCSEGTEIYWFGPLGAEDVEPDYEWREILMLSWDYPKIKAGIQVIAERMNHEINDVQYLPDVNGQPMIVINVPDKGKADNMIGKIDYELRQSQRLTFDMTCSSGGGNFFILIIPKGASKGSAAMHVSKRLGFRSEQVMVAGDGENDVPLFEATKEGFKGAIVGNAVEGLKTWVQRSPSKHMIHRSMSQQALGVLEGLHHHFPAVQ